jgi:hypothetical protein
MPIIELNGSITLRVLDHDASMALSDHIPVSAVISFKVNQDERLPKTSYYKVDLSLQGRCFFLETRLCKSLRQSRE